MASKEEWIEDAERLLPPKERLRERNAQITAQYAQLYLRQRDLFKWAGMAAFASFQVGLAMIPLGARATLADLTDDLEVIRETNNAVYRDIGWVHLAYEAGGFPEVQRCLGGVDLLAEGFERMAHAGRGARVDHAQAWAGNTMLLRHEQEWTVQPRFARLDKLFGYALTLTTMLDFDADHRRIDRQTVSAFSWFMMTQGYRLLLRTRSCPDVLRFDHRWFWIEQSLLPHWKRVDRSDPELERKMRRLAVGRLPF